MACRQSVSTPEAVLITGTPIEPTEYKINARYFSYSFMKSNPLPHKPSVAQRITTQPFRMKGIDANSLFARLWKQYESERTCGEVAKEDTPWMLTYSVSKDG